MNHDTLTPLLQLIKAGYKTKTNDRHLRGARLAFFFIAKWTIVLAAWAFLISIIYLISTHG